MKKANNCEKPTYLTDAIWEQMSEEEKTNLVKATKKQRVPKTKEIKYIEHSVIDEEKDEYCFSNMTIIKNICLKIQIN